MKRGMRLNHRVPLSLFSPVFNFQIRDSFKLFDVVGHQYKVFRSGMSGNQHIRIRLYCKSQAKYLHSCLGLKLVSIYPDTAVAGAVLSLGASSFCTGSDVDKSISVPVLTSVPFAV